MPYLDTIRHQEIFPPQPNDTGVTVIGLGAIGSRVAASLVELGLTHMSFYDFDRVEAHNLANQLYTDNDIGSYKADALSRWINAKLGTDADAITCHQHRVETPAHCLGTVFLLVDSLEERRNLFQNCLRNNPDVDHVIDVRMAASHGVVYSFNPHTQAAEYLATLGNDDDAEVSGCGSPFSVAPTAAVLANLAVWQFMNTRTNPAAHSNVSKLYLTPFILHTEDFA